MPEPFGAPSSPTKKSLQSAEWDFHGFFAPGIIERPNAKKRPVTYHRFGNDEGMEPLVIERYYDGFQPSHVELAEEFRLFHNLYHDSRSGKYHAFGPSGQEIEVAIIEADRVRVRLKHLKEFLAVKRMHLSIFWETSVEVAQTLAELGLRETQFEETPPMARVEFDLRDASTFGSRRPGTSSTTRGKKLVPGNVPKPAKYGGPEPAQAYPEFIIATDADGDPVTFTCDPDKLGNYFGANPRAPLYVTPVFFRRDVLQKYYARPSIYRVEDGGLWCGGRWHLRIDNNHPTHVVVLLGDLGRDLPEDERLYWRSFNVAPEGGFSETAWKRGFEAEFADPTAPDLVFKQKYEALAKNWVGKEGWSLFLPLPEGDVHHLQALRIPATEDQSEFDTQVLSLAKLLVDSLNENALVAHGAVKDPNAKGIAKLAAFLEARNAAGPSTTHIKFLRDLYSLRSSGAGHRKGSNYVKAAATFRVEEVGFRAAFTEILKQASALVDYLSALPPKGASWP